MYAHTGFKVYSLTFNALQLNGVHLSQFLDGRPEVRNWITIFPGQFLIVSNHNAGMLTEVLRGFFASELMLLAEILPGNATGWMPQAIWDFINNPAPSGYDFSSRPNGLASVFNINKPIPPANLLSPLK